MMVVSFSMAYRSFRGGSGRLDTHLDTPPSINRRHPDSCLALLKQPEYSTPEAMTRSPRGYVQRASVERLESKRASSAVRRYACRQGSGANDTVRSAKLAC